MEKKVREKENGRMKRRINRDGRKEMEGSRA